MTRFLMLPPVVLVLGGGGLGALGRYGAVVGAVTTGLRSDVATLGVNVLGCFCIGALYARTSDPTLRLLLGTGVLGGFTTFSTFSADTLALAGSGRVGAALGYVLASLGLGLAACLLGQWVAG